jgi:hypothetical protein
MAGYLVYSIFKQLGRRLRAPLQIATNSVPTVSIAETQLASGQLLTRRERSSAFWHHCGSRGPGDDSSSSYEDRILRNVAVQQLRQQPDLQLE